MNSQDSVFKVEMTPLDLKWGLHIYRFIILTGKTTQMNMKYQVRPAVFRPEAIKRESGKSPERSRRCIRESIRICHYESGKARKGHDLKSEDLPRYFVRLPPYEDREGDLMVTPF
jgi:hypothetical protein